MTKLSLHSVNVDEQVHIVMNEFPLNNMPNPFRVLDIGCGGGSVMAALHKKLKSSYPEILIEVFGFDVSEHSGGRSEFLNSVVSNLNSVDKNIDWEKRVFVVSETDQFPFPSDFFHCVLSNQVVEHVRDHDFFFSENYRVLAKNGIGIHQYGSYESWKDGHLNLLFVHKFLDFDIIRSYIRFLSSFGIGKYKGKYRAEKIKDGFGLEDYAEYQAEYMLYLVNYLSMKEALRLCKRNNLRATFTRYNLARFINRLKKLLIIRIIFKIFKINDRSSYFRTRGLFSNTVEKILLYYFSRTGSVTLLVEKRKLKRYGVFVK